MNISTQVVNIKGKSRTKQTKKKEKKYKCYTFHRGLSNEWIQGRYLS